MRDVALDYPCRSTPVERRRARRLYLLLRYLRRRRARRRLIRQVLNETRDPRVLADVGVAPPGRSVLERWPTALMVLHH